MSRLRLPEANRRFPSRRRSSSSCAEIIVPGFLDWPEGDGFRRTVPARVHPGPTAADATRATFSLGRSVTLEIKDFGQHNIEIIFAQTVYVDGVLTKKAISLSLRQWQQLMEQEIDIVEAVRDHRADQDIHYRYHLGRNRHVQVNSGFPVVDIRQFWLPADKTQVQPTRTGTALKFDEYETLLSIRKDIEQHIPELQNVVPCWMQEDHQRIEGALLCAECHPNGGYRLE